MRKAERAEKSKEGGYKEKNAGSSDAAEELLRGWLFVGKYASKDAFGSRCDGKNHVRGKDGKCRRQARACICACKLVSFLRVSGDVDGEGRNWGAQAGDGAPLWSWLLVELGKNGGRRSQNGRWRRCDVRLGECKPPTQTVRRRESDVPQVNENEGNRCTAPCRWSLQNRMVELLISVGAAEVGGRRQRHEMW